MQLSSAVSSIGFVLTGGAITGIFSMVESFRVGLEVSLDTGIDGGSLNNTGVTKRWNVSTGNGLVKISAILTMLGICANRTILAAIASRMRW